MAVRNDRGFDDAGYRPAARLQESILPVSDAELTDEHFIRGVALALRSEWEGGDYFGAAASNRIPRGTDTESNADWNGYRAESIAAILAFLGMLHHRGFRIVRKAN